MRSTSKLKEIFLNLLEVQVVSVLQDQTLRREKKMKNKSKIIEFIENLIELRNKKDDEGVEALLKEGRDKYVTLEDVTLAFMHIMRDLSTYVDVSQAIMEVRLRAIVESLPKDIQEDIYRKFDRAQDDLFYDEVTNDTENM